MKRLIETITCVSLLLIASSLHPSRAAAHPMDPLTADEIIFFDRNPSLDLRRAPFEVAP